MRLICTSLLLIALVSVVHGDEWLTRAEKTDYRETSLYQDVMAFLYRAQKQSEWIRIRSLGNTSEGRMIPLVIVSEQPIRTPADLHRYPLPVVLIMANIHAGEVEGKEACQMLLRDIVSGGRKDLLSNQLLLIVPNFNADGNEKLGRNRRDKGPELAGIRPNGQNLDLNRDYIKVESPEVQALIRLLLEWDPVLIVDMHTTNGSYHRNPVTYATMAHPNCDPGLQNFMWQKLFPAVQKNLKTKYGYDSIPYGNFADRMDPAKGWAIDAVEARYGSNYVGLRNRLTILDENYSYTDFKTRVLASLGFIQSILEFTAKNIQVMRDLTIKADQATVEGFRSQPFTLDSKLEKLFDVKIGSYEFVKEKIKEEDKAKYPPWAGEFIMRRTETPMDYTIPYLANPVPTRQIDLPEGYLILPGMDEVVNKLKTHGIQVERLTTPFDPDQLQAFRIEKLDLAKTIYQGHVQTTFTGKYEPAKQEFPAGSYYVSLRQPLARLVPVMLEPESVDGLAAWGYFNRVVVQQWSNTPSQYPVFRLTGKAPSATLIE